MKAARKYGNKPSGMGLRDWFAGQALAGRMATMDNPAMIDLFADAAKADGITMAEAVARDCYGFADAMLKARDGGENKNGGQPI